MTDKFKVLLVDDEERFRITTAKILERKGFQTILAESGEEALEKIKEKPDVVVLDIRMTGMDGEETLAKIKKRHPEIPVIMLTGHGERPSAQRTLDYGAFDYLAKPADIDLLSYKINEAILFGGSAKRDLEMVIEDLMIPIGEYVVLSPGNTIKEALFKLRDAGLLSESMGKLRQTGHREMLVVDSDGVVGMISMRDIVNAVRPSYLERIRSYETGISLRYSQIFWNGMVTMRLKELADCKLGEFTVPPPPPIDKDASLMEVCDRMHETSVQWLIVTDRSKVVGVIREQELFLEMSRILTI